MAVCRRSHGTARARCRAGERGRVVRPTTGASPRCRVSHTLTTKGTAMSTIEINGLSKRYGDVAAVDGLTFTVPEGTVTGFLGPNGAGKTTTLRLLLGLATPSAG